MTPEELAAAAAAKQATDDAAKLAAFTAAAAKAAADKAASDKAIADKAAADKVVADKAVADKAETDRIALSKLSDTEAGLLKEVMANKEKLKTAALEAAALAEKLKAFEGIDPAKAKELLAAQTKAAADKIVADEAALVKAGEFDRLKTMITDAHKVEMTAAQAAIKETKSALTAATKTINDLTVGASFNTSKFIGDELVLTPRVARDVYGDHFDIENGNVVAYDKPKGAEGRTKLVNGSGEALGFEDSIKKLVDAAPDKDQLMRSKLKTGARSTTTGDRARETSSTTASEVSGRELMLAALNKGALKKVK